MRKVNCTQDEAGHHCMILVYRRWSQGCILLGTNLVLKFLRFGLLSRIFKLEVLPQTLIWWMDIVLASCVSNSWSPCRGASVATICSPEPCFQDSACNCRSQCLPRGSWARCVSWVLPLFVDSSDQLNNWQLDLRGLSVNKFGLCLIQGVSPSSFGQSCVLWTDLSRLPGLTFGFCAALFWLKDGVEREPLCVENHTIFSLEFFPTLPIFNYQSQMYSVHAEQHGNMFTVRMWHRRLLCCLTTPSQFFRAKEFVSNPTVQCSCWVLKLEQCAVWPKERDWSRVWGNYDLFPATITGSNR